MLASFVDVRGHRLAHLEAFRALWDYALYHIEDSMPWMYQTIGHIAVIFVCNMSRFVPNSVVTPA